jgi:hypothetical protein
MAGAFNHLFALTRSIVQTVHTRGSYIQGGKKKKKLTCILIWEMSEEACNSRYIGDWYVQLKGY